MEFARSVKQLCKGSGGPRSKLQQCDVERWGLQGITLRPYQLEGLSWLAERHDRGHGCILGDEMGLGKTVQVSSAHRGAALSRDQLQRGVRIIYIYIYRKFYCLWVFNCAKSFDVLNKPHPSLPSCSFKFIFSLPLLQSISLLLYLHCCKKQRGPFLVLCPLSVIRNWQSELAR